MLKPSRIANLLNFLRRSILWAVKICQPSVFDLDLIRTVCGVDVWKNTHNIVRDYNFRFQLIIILHKRFYRIKAISLVKKARTNCLFFCAISFNFKLCFITFSYSPELSKIAFFTTFMFSITFESQDLQQGLFSTKSADPNRYFIFFARSEIA